jgi:hypothetical protein
MSYGKYTFRESELEAKSVLEKIGYSYLSPTQMRRVFLLLTRACFSNTDLYDYDGDLRDPPVVYDSKSRKRTVDVELDYLYDPEKVAESPTVYVGFGDINFKRLVVGDDARFSEDRSRQYFSNHSNTILHLRHVSPSGDMSYLLADQSLAFYLAMRLLLLANIPGLGDLKAQQLSKINLTSAEKTRNFRVDVTFDLTTMFGWHSDLEGHRLKEASIQIDPTSSQIEGC